MCHLPKSANWMDSSRVLPQCAHRQSGTLHPATDPPPAIQYSYQISPSWCSEGGIERCPSVTCLRHGVVPHRRVPIRGRGKMPTLVTRDAHQTTRGRTGGGGV